MPTYFLNRIFLGFLILNFCYNNCHEFDMVHIYIKSHEQASLGKCGPYMPWRKYMKGQAPLPNWLAF